MESPSNVQLVTLNVGGVKQEVLRSSLERHPQTRLGRLIQCNTHETIMELCDHYTGSQYFFDRRPQSFSTILDFYRTGKLHLADDTCVMAFCDDLKYWGVDEAHLEPCCQLKYGQAKEQVQDEMRKEAERLRRQEEEEEFGDSRWARCKKFIWNLFEKPNTSLAAKLVTVISVMFTTLFILALILNTVPHLMERDNYGYGPGGRYGYPGDSYGYRGDSYGYPVDNSHLAIVKFVCMVWFALEYLTRLATAPNKCKFIKDWLNIIDLLVIAPSLTLVFFLGPNAIQEVLLAIQVLRVLRLHKLVRLSARLQSLGLTLWQSGKELAVLLLYFTMGMVIFSTFAYLAERAERHTSFNSVPGTFWWAIITMTTVGYGDVVPVTPLGRVIGSICSISGVLFVAMSIAIVTKTFVETHRDQIRRGKSVKREEDHGKNHCSNSQTSKI